MARARCKCKDQDGWEDLSAEDQAATKAMAIIASWRDAILPRSTPIPAWPDLWTPKLRMPFGAWVEDIQDGDLLPDDVDFSNEENDRDFDDIAVDDDEVSPDPLAHVLDTEAVVQKFQSRLRVIIQGLKDIAHETKYNGAQAKSVYPLSYSYWFLLRQESTDDLMAAYIAYSGSNPLRR